MLLLYAAIQLLIFLFIHTNGLDSQVGDTVPAAIHYIEQEKRVSLGFKILHNFIISNENLGVQIDSEVYGRYAEAFWLLGKRGIPEDISIDVDRIIRACEIFLNAANSGNNNHYIMLALQTYSGVLHAIGETDKGANILNHLHQNYIVQSGFVCPKFKYYKSNVEISRIVGAISNGRESLNTKYHGSDGGTVDIWDTNDLTVDEFKKRYLIPRRLVKITGVTNGWKAVESWSWNNLPTSFRDVPNFVSWYRSSNCIQSFIMSDFFYHCPKNTYQQFVEPKYFKSLNDISYAFGLRLRGSYTDFMVFSHRGGGAGFHKDAYDQSFWNM